MTEKLKLPKDDVVFKNLFSSKENKDLIKELLEVYDKILRKGFTKIKDIFE